MHFLARGIGCAPQFIFDMEFVEFVPWIDLELEAQTRDAKQQRDLMAQVSRSFGVR